MTAISTKTFTCYRTHIIVREYVQIKCFFLINVI